MWARACCLAAAPSSERRILASEGRFGLDGGVLTKALLMTAVSSEQHSSSPTAQVDCL